MGDTKEPKKPFGQLAAGCLAGIFSDIITHPLSTVKTRIQVQGSGGGSHGALAYRGVCHGFAQIVKSEGPTALYRGLGIVLVGAAPAQGLYFAGYETVKSAVGDGSSTLGNFFAGVCAQLCGSLAWVPMDVIKERLQVEGQVKMTTHYTGSFHAFAQIVRNEGVIGLYRAFPIHQVTWAPFNGCYFMIYEKARRLCIDAGYEDGHDNLVPTAQLACGAAAGIIASTVTNPVDVLKTRLQVARANPDMFPYSSGVGALRHLLKYEGPIALMDGTTARVLWLTPRLSLCVAAYERLKVYLG